jgi:hypothetical protein
LTIFVRFRREGTIRGVTVWFFFAAFFCRILLFFIISFFLPFFIIFYYFFFFAVFYYFLLFIELLSNQSSTMVEPTDWRWYYFKKTAQGSVASSCICTCTHCKTCHYGYWMLYCVELPSCWTLLLNNKFCNIQSPKKVMQQTIQPSLYQYCMFRKHHTQIHFTFINYAIC